jgi:hypothetical protein
VLQPSSEEYDMSDDLRERQPARDLGDNPPESGTRSDVGASGGDGPAAPGPVVARTEQVATDTDDDATPVDPLADVEHPTADE